MKDGKAAAEMEAPKSITDEDRKMRHLRVIVDLTAAVLAQERITIDEALDLINGTKRAVLRLFPGKDLTYELIYGRRFQRILRERFESVRRDDKQSETGNR